MEEATQFIEGLKINHEALTDHQIKYLDVMHELLMRNEHSTTDPATIIQPTTSGERVNEYYDIDSDRDEECDNMCEYDSDNDHFYYD